MPMNGPEPDDVIGTEDPRATFEDFVEAAADRLLAAAQLVAGPREAQDLLAAVLERARRRWWWIARRGRDPERTVLRMLARASGRDRPDPDELARLAAATAGRPREPGVGPAPARPASDRPASDRPASDRPAAVLLAVAARHAQYVRRRAVACGVAGVVVLAAVWPVTSALRGGPPRHGITASHQEITASRSPLISAVSGLGSVPGPSPVGPAVHRAAGTILRECQDANNGQLSAHWRAYSVRAGPVWFMFGRTPGVWAASHRLAYDQLSGQAGVVAIRAGQRAVVRVTGPARARFHFLPGFNNSDVYTLRGGLPGLTLGGCPSVLTMFWQGYISTARCVPLVVRALPHGRPVHITLSPDPGACPRR
jgi:hypothetical protein